MHQQDPKLNLVRPVRRLYSLFRRCAITLWSPDSPTLELVPCILKNILYYYYYNLLCYFIAITI